MESLILQQQISFRNLIRDLLQAVDEEQLVQTAGSMRPGGRANILDWGDSVWLEQFRFTQLEMRHLVETLEMPEYIHCPESRNKEDRLTALCMLLHRLAYPTRLCDVEMQIGWERSRFSRITRATALFLYDRWKHLLRFDPHRLTRHKLADCAFAVQRKGCPLDVIASFIDGTLQDTARPSRNQRILYNGWKRIHCLKYQILITPMASSFTYSVQLKVGDMILQPTRKVALWTSLTGIFGDLCDGTLNTRI
ncbi:hypothetical protein K435DRAFT_855511 [Dendrothele bispora CBS 962.96]|uniref:DDE Tnp4 domain-containing protein n=1 Tax=Dendrothele bispora (strain CBS 962.96) TaxID=1314807 RepID=A0A4S8MBJ8_DENBC|nr:hypothetical protein K435DRAFT_855511 [Dendrothele bispora CBS 962.96]